MRCENCKYCQYPRTSDDNGGACKCRAMKRKTIDVMVSLGETPEWCPLKEREREQYIKHYRDFRKELDKMCVPLIIGEIVRKQNGFNIVANGNEFVGQYKEVERCVEILDEIQELLTPHLEPLIVEEKKGEEINFDFANQPSGAIYSGTATITEYQTIVYAMPKD